MALWLREEDEWPGEATLVIHGGEGQVDYVLTAAIDHYDDYRELRDGVLGYFTVSVFATIHNVAEEAIVDHLVHGSYGVAAASAVNDAFKLLPTADDDPDLPPDIQWLQPVHFDVCLPDPPDERLKTTDPVDDPALTALCEAHLRPHLEELLSLFTRSRKK
jgi:hypothetical protein